VKEEKPTVALEGITIKTVLEQAARTGFFIDEEDAKKLIEKTDPSWFGDHSFISFIAIKIREHEKYSTKPLDEQRRIFRKILLDADNYRQEYPSWREKQAEKDHEYAQETERRNMLVELRKCPPVQCECGTELDGELRCPICGRFYWLDEEEMQWMSSKASLKSFSEGFRKHIRKTTEVVNGQ
jgi:hypothetical protein